MSAARSKRLAAIAAMVTVKDSIADIGTDHAFIPVFLVGEGKVLRALAMDINPGPLEGARSNIRQAGLEGKISCRLSDGMQALSPGEVSGCVIAGMGGDLTLRILQKYPEKTASLSELVLSPQSEIARVRRWLRTSGWIIRDEEMLTEDGKFYTVMRAVPADKRSDGQNVPAEKAGSTGNMPPAEEEYLLEDFYGPVLLQKKHPVLDAFLKREMKIQQQILGSLAGAAGEEAMRRREEVLAVCRRNEEAARLIGA